MGKVYKNGIVNVAASASVNSEGGLFFHRNPLLVQPLQVKSRFPPHDSAKPMMYYTAIIQKPYGKNIEKAPLNGRGWVMQERTLAPRILHCTAEQLFWECRESLACESYPDGIQTMHDRKKLEQYRLQPEAALHDAHITWFRLIEHYSTCKLTREEDLLVVIAGIAKEWGEATKDAYLVGLWRRNLPLGLLWHLETIISNISNTKYPISRAPSWSWASFKGAV